MFIVSNHWWCKLLGACYIMLLVPKAASPNILFFLIILFFLLSWQVLDSSWFRMSHSKASVPQQRTMIQERGQNSLSFPNRTMALTQITLSSPKLSTGCVCKAALVLKKLMIYLRRVKNVNHVTLLKTSSQRQAPPSDRSPVGTV